MWLLCCHIVHDQNGVRCLATFITEWEAGAEENLLLLNGPTAENQHSDEPSSYYVEKLVRLCCFFGFDGYFFNIEAPLPSQQHVRKMVKFVSQLSSALHAAVPGSLVIWYDSLDAGGRVRWQSALNEENYAFFEACDGIFLDYHWTPEKLVCSACIAGRRRYDVYTGIDVWGRGTFGGGGYGCGQALQAIRTAGTSLGVFAPGWTFESQQGESLGHIVLELNEAKFWRGRNLPLWLTGSLLQDGLCSSSNPLPVASCQSSVIEASCNCFPPSKSMYDISSFRLGEWQHVVRGGDGFVACEDGIVTSYQWCVRAQLVDLEAAGLPQALLDSSPPIYAAERFIGTGPNPKDSFALRVSLLDGSGRVLSTFYSQERHADKSWRIVEHTFRRYPRGLLVFSIISELVMTAGLFLYLSFLKVFASFFGKTAVAMPSIGLVILGSRLERTH